MRSGVTFTVAVGSPSDCACTKFAQHDKANAIQHTDDFRQTIACVHCVSAFFINKIPVLPVLLSRITRIMR